MRTRPGVIALSSMMLVGLAVAPGLVFAQAPPAAPVHHRHQTGLSLMPGTGYRVIVPYQENQACGDSSGQDSKRVCTNQVPWFLDLQLSFGITEPLDLLLDLRFALSKDPASKDRPFAVAPGLRVWLDPETDVKFYTTVQALIDWNDHKGHVRTTDFGLRNSNGLMYDPIRNVGIFVQFGESLGFARWFRIEMDVGVGVQVRLP